VESQDDNQDSSQAISAPLLVKLIKITPGEPIDIAKLFFLLADIH
jgi:hypothetical protein